MPSIIVVPDYQNESAFAGPVIGGVTFRRPTGLSESFEPVRQSVELGGGETRTYTKGRRRVFSVSWGRLVRAELDALAAAVAPPFVTFSKESGDGVEYVVDTDSGLSADALAGTYPVRYSASITLRERRPS